MRARKLLATTLMVAALGTGLAQPASAEEAAAASIDTACTANSSQQGRTANLPAENVGKAKDTATMERIGVNVCMECGSCAYSCPAAKPLVQYMRLAKAMLREEAAKK